MSIQWNYKIQLKNTEIFEKIENDNGIKIPNELRTFIEANNGAYPTPNCVDINGEERVYDATLSFNEKEEDATTFLFAMKVVANPDYIPFAQDPFGNYYCYEWKNKTVSFYNHEDEMMDDTEVGLDAFIKSFHEPRE